MYYSNYEFKADEADKKRILYVSSIGSDADKVLNEVFKRLWLTDPKIRKTRLGNLNVVKYSFIFNSDDHFELTKRSMRHMLHNEFRDSVMLTTQDSRNWYVMNRIEF